MSIALKKLQLSLFVIFFFIGQCVALPVLAKKINGFDVSNSLVPKKALIHGGPPRDSIPAIMQPNYVSADQAIFMKPDDIVLGFEFHGNYFAFPRYILNWHELVNDEVQGKPFLISYCPLCGSGMAFSSRLKSKAKGENVDDTRLIFGVSGILYNSDLVFYDKNTESLWSQIEGRAISGKYAGAELTQLALQHTSWARWSSLYPQTKVLSEQQEVKRNYRHDPYSGYETSSQLFFKTLRKTPGDYHTKEKVLGVQWGDQQKAYPYVELRKTGLAQFEDSLGDQSYLVVWDAQHETAHIEALPSPQSAETNRSKSNQSLPVTTTAFWFAWYNFYPETDVYRYQAK